jgi:hypothetical protein
MTSLLSIQYVTPTSHKLVANSSCSTFKAAAQLPEMYRNQRRLVSSPPLNHNRLAYVDALVGKVF